MACALVAAQGSLRFARILTRDPRLSRIAAASGDFSGLPRDQCMTFGTSSAVKECVYGDSSSRVNVVLFGDSHAQQWFGAMRRLSIAHRWRLTPIVKAGCPAADASLLVARGAQADACTDWRRAAFRAIAAIHPNLVVVSSSTVWRAGAGGGLAREVDEWRLGTAQTLSALSPSADAVVVLRDTPTPPFDVPTCLARSARHRWYPRGDCKFARAAAVEPSIYAAEQQAGAGLKNVRFADVTDALC
jgi:hypothetical protein